jgi:putative IMPACT (imprinted ancient) family translation regulator
MDSFSEKRVVRKFGSSLKKREKRHACVEFISFEHEQVELLLQTLYDSDAEVGKVGVLILGAGELRLGTYTHR